MKKIPLTKLINHIFSRTIITKSGCREWQGYKLKSGYGRIWFNGKPELLHRVIYTINKGIIPDKMYVCHHCDNPSCVNPEHLFIGTQKDNMKDCRNKGRTTKGFQNSSTIVTHEKRIELLQMILKGFKYKIIANKYGISRTRVSQIALKNGIKKRKIKKEFVICE
jgi:hypothetical protein